MSTTKPAAEADAIALEVRDVAWDWTGLPVHYVDDDPIATHTVNTFNMLLPEGEVFFVQVFQKALKLIRDDVIREEVVGFIGQEATHSAAHQSVLDHFHTVGLDTDPFVDQVRFFFRGLLGDRELSGSKEEAWLIQRVAMIAALEHVTSYLGDWILNNPRWEEAFEPRMFQLFQWHMAEEVEHRHVAFNLYTHLDGSYWHRIRAHVTAAPVFALFIWRGLRFLTTIDRDAPSGVFSRIRGYRRAARRGLVPSFWGLVRMSLLYFRPGYHPSDYGSTSQAVAVLASHPAALATA